MPWNFNNYYSALSLASAMLKYLENNGIYDDHIGDINNWASEQGYHFIMGFADGRSIYLW